MDVGVNAMSDDTMSVTTEAIFRSGTYASSHLPGTVSGREVAGQRGYDVDPHSRRKALLLHGRRHCLAIAQRGPPNGAVSVSNVYMSVEMTETMAATRVDRNG